MDILTRIIRGEFDDSLKEINSAIRERQKLVRATKTSENMLTLSVGSKGKLTGLSPKYINGSVVEIVELRRTRVMCRLDPDKAGPRTLARFGRRSFTVPASCVNPI